MRTPTALRPAIIPLAFILLFVALGVVFLRYAGFEDDEALIVSGSYTREGFAYVVRLGSYRVPLMLMSYVGALKSWIYAAVFSLWQPSVFSVRVPALLLGGLTIWIVYRMLWTLAGQRAALIGSVLLSTDTTFLLTTCFDWGPVVLQHLLLASGLLNLIYFDKFRKQGHLAAGVFFFGLAVWDKALFAWILGGMTVAALVSFPRKVFDSITMRNLSIAGLSFCLGSAPLIAYNLSSPMATLRTTTAFSTDSFAEKKANLYSAFSGKALFGYLVRNDARGFSNKPKNALETGSVRLSKAFNHPVS